MVEPWRALYPFQSRWFGLRGGLRMHYLDEGQGAPVVMVHGNPSWSFYWRELVKDLRADHRVIAMDHVGMGLSDKPDELRYDYTLKSRVDDLEALLDELGIKEKVTLVVHDWGGMIGLSWACRHPGRVARLVITNTAAFLPPAHYGLPAPLALARSGLGAWLVRGLNLFCRGAVKFCAKERVMTPAVSSGYLAPYDSWENRVAVHNFVLDIPTDEEHPAYELVKWTDQHLGMLKELPVLLVWGGRDFVFTYRFYDEFQRRFPKAEAHHLKNARHYVLEDDPGAVVALTRDFLARHPL
jgi:haloalkane dehalogenase